MRGIFGWVAAVAFAAACATPPSEPHPAGGAGGEPLAAGLAALAAARYEEAGAALTEAGRRYPSLEDYALYFRARAAAQSKRWSDALEAAVRVASRPDSVWAPRAMLLAGELRRRSGDLDAARDWLTAAREQLATGGDAWARATVSLAEVEEERGDFAAAFGLAGEVRRARPRGLADRRARRLVDRVTPKVEVDPVEEAEVRLREGDAAAASDTATAALAGERPPAERARALWVVAQAKRALGEASAAEATCVALGRDLPDEPLAARAMVAAATWRWNADDDASAQALFRDTVSRFPESPQAAEALYAIGRIQQEAGRWVEAASTYRTLADRYPDASVADDARWRAAWVRYLASDFSASEEGFRRLAETSTGRTRAAAAYWRARSLAHLGRNDEAAGRFAAVAEEHPRSYYAGLAEERLGRTPPPADGLTVGPSPTFPGDLEGAHAERARLLLDLGFPRFARLEVNALRASGMPAGRLLDAYTAIGAPGAALRLAREVQPESPGPLARYLYPLGYWDAVEPAARGQGVDPLLVLAVIRQESLFDPDAVSAADAHGLMQLLPTTAKQLSPAPPGRTALHDVATNVQLGVALLARLIQRHGGSLPRALAAYNAGDDAVAKWERRYEGRDPDEFVELISFRETRDYVKSVLANYRVYRIVYAPGTSAPSPLATSLGSPPKAPFDMMTMTSPARAEATR